MDFQSITACLIGNATRDAEIKLARDSEHRYGDFRMAVRNHTGETLYFPVRCFGKLAEGVSHIKKGTKLFVQGDLEIASFADSDGDKRMTFRVVASAFHILGPRRNRLPDPDVTE
jgi:single-stranded DNA-binding protein